MSVSVTKEKFIETFPFIIEGELFEDERIKKILGDVKELPDNVWKAINYMAEIYISADTNPCILSNSLREKGIYLTIAVYLLKTISNFLLRRNSSQMSSAKEGEVSVSYQDIPNSSIKDWFLTDPAVQPFGMLLWQILQNVQPCIAVNLSFPAPYYNTWGFNV